MTGDTQKIQEAQIVKNDNAKSQVNMRYSGFWVRGAAHIIDGFIVGILSMFVGVPLGILLGVASAFSGSFFLNAIGQFIGSIVGLAIGWAYYIFMTHKFQATVGKMAIGVKVCADNGDVLPLEKIIIRETVGKIVSALMFFVGYVMIAFTPKKRGLHDMIAHSIVVYEDPEKGPNKIVVGVVYGVYAFVMFVCLCIFSVILFFIGIAAFGESLDSNDGDLDTGEFEYQMDEEMLNDLYMEISDEYSIEEL